MVHRHGWLRWFMGLGMIVLLIGQTGCKERNDLHGVAMSGQELLRRSHSRYADETGERTYAYEVQPVEGSVEVCIRIVLQAGVQHWQLTDPEGRQTRWDAEVDDVQPYRASHCFDAESGDGVLDTRREDATGEYAITCRHPTEAAGEGRGQR